MSVLAFDLGAGSGRTLSGEFDGSTIKIQELHRFANEPVRVGDRLHWDILRLYHEIKQGMLKAKHEAKLIQSIGLDSWGVDFGLLSKGGELLGNPYHYRDHQTNGMMEKLFSLLPRQHIFQHTGIQFMQFNTIFQLFAMQQAGSPLLEQADALLLIPELLRYFLTGEKFSEFTITSTTQLYNPLIQQWDASLLAAIGVPQSLFAEVVMPGTAAGVIRESVRQELGVGQIPVIAVAEHDTGSAVASIPASEPDFAYLICGTWSLMGTEVASPVMTEAALAANFTNEGGVGGTYRLLNNIMGLWLIEECRRAWFKAGKAIPYPEMIDQAQRAEPFRSLIDPDHPVFLNPQDMLGQIKQYCRVTGQPVPVEIGEVVRCILESLALKYRTILELTEQLAGRSFAGLHMVGGGIKNKLLCQFTASAIGRPVWAGPEEGSAIGNILVQYIQLGEFRHVWDAREAVRESFPIETYEPTELERWNEAYQRFTQIIKFEI